MSLPPPKDLPGELHDALSAAKTSTVLIKCETYNDAVSLRSKIVSYLKSLEKSLDGTSVPFPFSDVVVSQNKETVILRPGSKLNIVVVTPQAQPFVVDDLDTVPDTKIP